METQNDFPGIVNRVTNSSLVSIDLETMYPEGDKVIFDLKDHLYQGLILREKDFRAFLMEHDWTTYTGKNVAILCSEDAIIPTWAYMLVVTRLQPYANLVIAGTLEQLETFLWQQTLKVSIKPEDYLGAKVVVKGCSKKQVPLYAYAEVSRILKPVVQSLLFGEPCSTVPIYKKK